MIVASTSRIELGAASWATKLALQVLMDRQLYPTGTAKYCFLAPFALWPDFDFVFAQRSVAFLARIVDATALHLDRNDVGGSVKVFAPGLRIEIHATHLWKVRSHGTKKKQRPSADGQQFFVESANLPDAIHEVDLEYPMSLSARSIWHLLKHRTEIEKNDVIFPNHQSREDSHRRAPGCCAPHARYVCANGGKCRTCARQAHKHFH